jgi:hypothetical protein
MKYTYHRQQKATTKHGVSFIIPDQIESDVKFFFSRKRVFRVINEKGRKLKAVLKSEFFDSENLLISLK